MEDRPIRPIIRPTAQPAPEPVAGRGFFHASTMTGSGPKTITLPQCGKCGLYKLCQSPKMPPTGAGRIKVLFVGEAPGAKEDEQNTQLIGDAGQLLRRMLSEACDLDLDECWKTNAVICRPPKNKIEDVYLESCRPNLLRTIKELRPKVIIPMGSSAIYATLGPHWADDIGPTQRWVGWKIPIPEYGAWVCPTYHPSFLLRTGEDVVYMNMVKGHLQAAVNLLDRPLPPVLLDNLKKQIRLVPDAAAGIELMRDLNTRAGRLAIDYECTGLKPERPEQRIYSCAFSFEGQFNFSTLITPASYPALSAVLKNPRLLKIASNLKMEERWSRAKLGHGVAGWYHDTMLAAHVLDNRAQITSIKFQSFIRYGIGDYARKAHDFYWDATAPNELNHIDEAPVLDVLEYGGLDALLEFLVCLDQRKEMGL